ncbi:hypothetical protein MC28_D202 (plasmid) [Bacillus thuringiensis MC28]|nr:hypothetical protein MC28_D202 [Bacillus thuringiensis MC28]
MNAVEREHKISKLKSEINDIWTSLAIGSVFYLVGLCLEPMLKEVANLGGIDHSKDKPNQYEKGDRGMMKRVFNQNNNVSINSGKGNTSKTKSKGSPTRSYNGTTRSSNNTESNNIALDVALGSSIYSRGNDNDCSSSNGSGYDGGSSCD